MERFGEQFIHEKEPKLHTTEPVEHEQKRLKRRGEKISQKPAEKISAWLEVIKRTHTGHREDPGVMERIKDYYNKKYAIKPEDIPESYFENQKRLAREQGHGDIKITDEMRRQLVEVIVSDQKSTLDNWVDYFSSPDADAYPMWAKYWAFTNMLKLSTFDKEKHAFGKRDKGTVAPFPDLNREALAYVVDAIVKKTSKEKVQAAEDNPEFKKILQGESFGKLYAWAIEKVTPAEESELKSTAGEWKKYDRNSGHMPLVESLQGHGTGWCTAGESTAKAQLGSGDFYVYYSYDKNDQPTVPRVAIRMEEGNIAEVRGVAADQNLDPYIGKVVEEKLAEFPDGKAYQKKSADMKRLTEIDRKNTAGEKLNAGDLRFIYEIDAKIQGFGYRRDPRIKEILAGRDVKNDISLATGFSKDQISTTQVEVEALGGGIKFHFGVLNLSGLQSAEGAEGLKLPETVTGNLSLGGLQSAEGLKLPETINGNLDLGDLQSAEGLELPETIGGSLFLSGLQSAEGLNLPEMVHGGLILSGLQSAEGLNLPEVVEGNLYLSGLRSAKGLKLPQKVGFIDLSGLQSAEGLELPEGVSGVVDLSGVPLAEKKELRKKYPKLADKIL
jgi:hypothetical protein